MAVARRIPLDRGRDYGRAKRRKWKRRTRFLKIKTAPVSQPLLKPPAPAKSIAKPYTLRFWLFSPINGRKWPYCKFRRGHAYAPGSVAASEPTGLDHH